MKNIVSPRDIVRSGMCIGCGVCVANADHAGLHMQFDAFGNLYPKGESQWFHKPSRSFSAVCPFSPSAENEDQLSGRLYGEAGRRHPATGPYTSNFVGHVLEADFRNQGSSGGMVSWVAAELIRKNLVDGVAHVVETSDPDQEGRYFKYRISSSENEIREGAKSRYYPVELSEVLKTIRETPGRYAVVAVPCMIKAVQLLRRENPVYHERIRFTLGLFCGHMKSARFVESFAWQMNVPLKKVKKVEFRYKIPGRPANWYNAMLTLDDGRKINKDWWNLVDGDWGAGFFMNSACNFCDDVTAETADISFGDAWVEPYASDGNGTNVVVTRSPLIGKLLWDGIEQGRLHLQEASAGLVAQTQAAGLRQRREGLSYRLTWAAGRITPVKRLPPNSHIKRERKLIYRCRYYISIWSSRVFWLARKVNMPGIYLQWARVVASIYYGIAHHQYSLQAMKERFVGLWRAKGRNRRRV